MNLAASIEAVGAMDFYVYLNGVRRGPFGEERVQASLAAGLLHSSDLVCDGPDGELRPLSAFERFQADRIAALPESQGPAPHATAIAPVLLERVPDRPRTPAAPSDVPSLAIESLGPYSRATLAPNETPYHKTSLHWIVFFRFGFLALGAFFFLALPFAIAVQALAGSQLGWFVLPLPAFLLVTPSLAYVSSELVITDRRVLIKSGIIQRQTLEMFISKVESIGIDQSFCGRLLDYGTVSIRGTGGFEERFEAIAHPLDFRNWVQRMQGGGPRAPSTLGM